MLDYNFDLRSDREKIQKQYPHLAAMMGSHYYGQDMNLMTDDPHMVWKQYIESSQLVNGKWVSIPIKVATDIISDIVRFLNEFTDEKEVNEILLRGFNSGFGLIHAGEPMGGLLKLKSQLEAYIKEHTNDVKGNLFSGKMNK